MRIFLLSGNRDGSGIYKLSKKEQRYLFSVLRLSMNDTFTAKDKDGRYFKAFLYDEESLALEETDHPEETLLDDLSAFKGSLLPITMMISVLKNKKNEGTYIYLDEPYWDAAAKMGRHRMKCIGKFGLMERMSTMKPIRQALKKTGPSWSQRQYSLERG